MAYKYGYVEGGQAAPTGGADPLDAFVAAQASQADPLDAFVASQGGISKTAVSAAPSQAAPQRSTLGELGRQIGLTTRAGVTGLAGLPNMLGDVLNTGVNAVTGGVNRLAGTNIPQLQMPSAVTQQALNVVGLPQPENAQERVAQDVASALAGTGGQFRLGQALMNVPSAVGRGVGATLTAAPGAQIAGTAGGAAASGATREAGGGEGAQLAAGVLGSLAPVVAASGTTALIRSLQNPTRAPLTAPNIPLAAEEAVAKVTKESGQTQPLTSGRFTVKTTTQGEVPAPTTAQQADAQAVAKALQRDPTIDPKALARAQDFRELGMDPTLGQITRDAAQYSRERNIRGAQGIGEPLMARLNTQNNQLQEHLNALRGQPMEKQQAGAMLDSALKTIDDNLSSEVSGAYKAARESAGKDLDVPLQGIAQRYAKVLKDFGNDVPSGVRNHADELGLMTGTQRKVFTLEDADNLLKVINKNVSATDTSRNAALSELRSAVKEAVLSADTKGGPFAPAVALAKQRFDLLDAIPALKSVTQGKVDPDDFVRRFIINGKTGDVNELATLLKNQAPEAYQEARNQLGNELNRKAFGTNTAGDKQFTPERFNEALNNIGTKKLAAFFTPDEISTLQRVGRVGAYIQSPPSNHTVNASNTAVALANTVTARLPGMVEHIPIPGAKLLGNALRAGTAGMEERAFVNQAINPNLSGTGTRMTKAEADLAAKILGNPTVRVPTMKPSNK